MDKVDKVDKVDVSHVDFAEINALLSIVHQCAGIGPKLSSIAAVAMAELEFINADLKVQALEIAERQRVKDAEIKAKADAEAKAAADAEVVAQDEYNRDQRIKPRAIPANQVGA